MKALVILVNESFNTLIVFVCKLKIDDINERDIINVDIEIFLGN